MTIQNSAACYQYLFQSVIQEILQDHSVMPSSYLKFINNKVMIGKESDLASYLFSVILQILTVFSAIITWLVSYYSVKSGSYFLSLWVENILFLISFHILMNLCNKNYTRQSLLFHDLYLTWRLWLSFIILTIVYGLDFITFTKKSAGTEFMQFSQVLSLPTMCLLLHLLCDIKLQKWIYPSIFITTIWKIMSLCFDTEFKFTFYLSVCCSIYSSINCYYLILVKAFLMQGSVLQLLYYQSIVSVFYLPIVILASNYLKLSSLSPEFFFGAFILAVFKFVGSFVNLLLLKKIDLLTSIAVLNVPLLANDLIKALVHKLDCHISAIGVEILFIWDWISLNLATKKE